MPSDVNDVNYSVYLTEIQKNAMELIDNVNQTLVTEEDNEKYEDFIKWLYAVNYMVEDFYIPDENGNLPRLDAVAIKAFQDSYNKALAECDKVIGSKDTDQVSAKMKKIAVGVRTALIRDLRAFNMVGTGDNVNLTMDEIVEQGNSLTIDIGTSKLDPDGNTPLKVMGAPGGDLDGFFMPELKVDTTGDIERLLQELGEKYPNLRKIFNDITLVSFPKYRDSGLHGLTLGEAIYKEAKEAGEEFPHDDAKNMKLYAKEHYVSCIMECIGNNVPYDVISIANNEPDFVKAVDEFTVKYSNIVDRYRKFVDKDSSHLGSMENSNINNRSVAVTDIFTYLGKDNAIAHAQPMTVIQNGKIVKGTFVNRAFGYSVLDTKDNNPIEKMDILDYNNPAVFDDIAALQAGDFISGSVARNSGNLMLSFGNVNGKQMLTGVKGIGNTLSFGGKLYEQNEINKLGTGLIRPNNMCAIGKKTADKILELDENKLKDLLKGHNLSRRELDAAWERTKLLKKEISDGLSHYANVPVGRIDKGHLRVIPEVEWSEYTITDFADGINQFYYIINSKYRRNSNKEVINEKKALKEYDVEARKALFGEKPKNVPIVGKATLSVKQAISDIDRIGVNDPDTIKIVFPADAQIKKVGNISERYMVSYTNENNEVISGYFTASSSTNYKKQFRDVTNKFILRLKASGAHPEWIDVLEKSCDYMIQDDFENRTFRREEYDLSKLGYEQNEIDNFLEDEEFRKFYDKYLAKIDTAEDSIKVSYRAIGASMDSTIDRRNVAFYKVGEQLGVDSTVAKTQNAQILVGDRMVEGVFMEHAPGVTCKEITEEEYPHVHENNSSVFDGSMALRDIAELQILGFICQSADMHTGNFIFKFSEDKTKCESVTAIDNDVSFGTKKIGKKGSIGRTIPLNKIKVISERMAEKINNLSIVAFTNTLKGQGLAESEIKETINRLVMVKEALNSGEITIYKDSDWKKKKIEDFGKYNLFDTIDTAFWGEIGRDFEDPVVHDFTMGVKVDSFDKDYELIKYNEVRRDSAAETFAESLYEDVDLQQLSNLKTDAEFIDIIFESASKLYGLIDDGISIFHGASKYYTDLHENINEFKQDISRLKSKVENKGTLSKADYSTICSGYNTFINLSNEYIDHVNNVLETEGSNSKTQKRRKRLVNRAIKRAEKFRDYTNSQYELSVTKPDYEKVFHRKMADCQRKVDSVTITKKEFENNLAELIYLSGISRNIIKLVKNNKLKEAIYDKAHDDNVKLIKETEEFKTLIKKSRVELIALAKSSNAKNLFVEYAGLFAENNKRAELKPKSDAVDKGEVNKAQQEKAEKAEKPVNGQTALKEGEKKIPSKKIKK